MSEKAKITIELPAAMKAELIAEAEREDIDLSKLCRRILKQHRRVLTESERVAALGATEHAARIEQQAAADLAAESAAIAQAAT